MNRPTAVDDGDIVAELLTRLLLTECQCDVYRRAVRVLLFRTRGRRLAPDEYDAVLQALEPER